MNAVRVVIYLKAKSCLLNINAYNMFNRLKQSFSYLKRQHNRDTTASGYKALRNLCQP